MSQHYVLHCSGCGKPMSVAYQHVRLSIACPHCGHVFRPAATTQLGEVGMRPVTAAEWPEADPLASTRRHARHIPRRHDAGISDRNRIIAGLLGIFLGSLGLHRFYLGYHGIGAVMLGLTLLGISGHGPCACFSPVVALWGMTEGVLCLFGLMRDARGRLL